MSYRSDINFPGFRLEIKKTIHYWSNLNYDKSQTPRKSAYVLPIIKKKKSLKLRGQCHVLGFGFKIEIGNTLKLRDTKNLNHY